MAVCYFTLLHPSKLDCVTYKRLPAIQDASTGQFQILHSKQCLTNDWAVAKDAVVMKSPESSSCEYLDNWRDVQLHVTRQMMKIIRLDNASVNSTCAQPPPPPGLLRGICPPCQSRGWGICKICTARGPGNVSWLLDQISVDIIWRTSFVIIKLFITYNFKALY